MYHFLSAVLLRRNLCMNHCNQPLYEYKSILMVAVFGCFTMQSVMWPNAPIIGGWAVFFQLSKIHILLFCLFFYLLVFFNWVLLLLNIFQTPVSIRHYCDKFLKFLSHFALLEFESTSTKLPLLLFGLMFCNYVHWKYCDNWISSDIYSCKL